MSAYVVNLYRNCRSALTFENWGGLAMVVAGRGPEAGGGSRSPKDWCRWRQNQGGGASQRVGEGQ